MKMSSDKSKLGSNEADFKPSLVEFSQNASDFYKADELCAGIHVSWLRDKQIWYIAVHRFPNNVEEKIVVCNGKHKSFGIALMLCWANWLKVRNVDIRLESAAWAEILLNSGERRRRRRG